jgi:hypothetical protein
MLPSTRVTKVHEPVLKNRRLSELWGALPVTRPFPGTDVIREEAGKTLGEDLERRTLKTALANRSTFIKSE